MRFTSGATCLAVLVVAQVCAADPPTPAPAALDLGGAVTVEVGKKCVLTAETSAKKVTWRVPAGVDTLPLDGKRLAVWADVGKYTFTAMVPNGDDVIAAEVVLTVTGPRPPPPPPDALIASLTAAYAADPSATKAADKSALAAVFRACVSALDAPDVKTAQNLFDVIHGATQNRIQGRLRTVRDLCGTELGKVLPSASGAALTAQHRDDAKKQLARFADILDGVK